MGPDRYILAGHGYRDTVTCSAKRHASCKRLNSVLCHYCNNGSMYTTEGDYDVPFEEAMRIILSGYNKPMTGKCITSKDTDYEKSESIERYIGRIEQIIDDYSKDRKLMIRKVDEVIYQYLCNQNKELAKLFAHAHNIRKG